MIAGIYTATLTVMVFSDSDSKHDSVSDKWE